MIASSAWAPASSALRHQIGPYCAKADEQQEFHGHPDRRIFSGPPGRVARRGPGSIPHAANCGSGACPPSTTASGQLPPGHRRQAGPLRPAAARLAGRAERMGGPPGPRRSAGTSDRSRLAGAQDRLQVPDIAAGPHRPSRRAHHRDQLPGDPASLVPRRKSRVIW